MERLYSKDYFILSNEITMIFINFEMALLSECLKMINQSAAALNATDMQPERHLGFF
jgi:hypothetical protein